MTDRVKTMTVVEFEQFLRQPENADRLFELIDGEIFEKMPTEKHGEIVLTIGFFGKLYLRENPIGRFTTEARHSIEDDDSNDVLPDVSFILDASRPSVEEGVIPRMPDFAVEVKSPSDKLPILRTKVAYYLRNGTRLVWLVIPEKRLVEVYRPDEPVLVCDEDDVLDGGDVLPGFKVAVKELFAD